MDNYIPIFAALSSFAVTALIGIPFVPFLKKLKYGQTILDDGPKWHKEKEGTPTMGGIMIVLGVIAGILVALTVSLSFKTDLIGELSGGINPIVFAAGIIFSLMCCGIGLMDDYIKVVKKRNLGLTAKQKTVLQLLSTTAYLATLAIGGVNRTWIPFIGDVDIMHGFGLLFWPVSLIFIYYIVNAVNLTDGIDGLASCVTLVVSCAFMLICSRVSNESMSCLAAVLGGACVGFILWNSKPAKVFMGDTGSMFLGGMVVALAYGCGRPVLLIPIGIVYICEALSVVLQVFWFKTTGKRIFKMSPIHHHYEMSGWSEDKICLIFSLVALIFSAVAVASVYFAW